MSKEEISMEEQPLCSHTINKCPIEFKPSKQEKYKYSEEEKKSIQELKEFINKYEPFVFYSKLKGDTVEVNPHMRDYETYKTILNLIEKQQNKIKDVKIRLEYYLMGNFIFNDEAQKEFKKLFKMLEE